MRNQTTTETTDAPEAILDRRAFVRHPCNLSAFWQFLGLSARDLTSGLVFDLSEVGVGLLLDQPFEQGDRLVIRLPTMSRGFVSYLSRIVRCQPTRYGLYQIGCEFVRPLTPEQVRGHLGS